MVEYGGHTFVSQFSGDRGCRVFLYTSRFFLHVLADKSGVSSTSEMVKFQLSKLPGWFTAKYDQTLKNCTTQTRLECAEINAFRSYAPIICVGGQESMFLPAEYIPSIAERKF